MEEEKMFIREMRDNESTVINDTMYTLSESSRSESIKKERKISYAIMYISKF